MRNQSAVAAAFDALGEPVRRSIVEALRDGPLPVGRLAERMPVGRPAVSKHLRVLAEAGLVRHEQRGTRNLYALAPEGLVALQQWLVATWDLTLQRYADAVRDTAGPEASGRDTAGPEASGRETAGGGPSDPAGSG